MADCEQRNQPKPPRLRSACNQCNSAKVKCTGERDCCSRCKSLRAECIYTESRVGKVQGSRTKRKKSHPLVLTTVSVSAGGQINDQATIDVSVPPVHSPKSHVPTSLEEALNWSSEPWTSGSWDDEILSIDGPMAMFGDLFDGSTANFRNNSSSGDMMDSLMTSNTRSTIGSGLVFSSDLSSNISTSDTSLSALEPSGNAISSPSPTTLANLSVSIPAPPINIPPASSSFTTVTPAAHSERSAREAEIRTVKLDSNCILACTQIIITLENYLLAELKALDLILDAVRKAADELRKLIQYQQNSRRDRCMLLFFTIMDQIIELLEAGSRSLSDTGVPDIGGGLLSNAQTSFISGFGFGAFSITVEEQRSWRSYIVRREYQHIGEILQSITTQAKLGPKGRPPSEATGQRAKCLEQLERRLKDLCEKVGG